jgi:hypothetical protein
MLPVAGRGRVAGRIILNLLTGDPTKSSDVALRDFDLFLGALTLNRLATARAEGAIAPAARPAANLAA